MSFSGSTFGRYGRRWLIAIGMLELVLAVFFVIGAQTIPFVGAGFMLAAGILGLTGLLLIGFGIKVGRSAAATDRILQTGTGGEATVTGLTQTGMYLNENPQVAMSLRVHLPGRPPYTANRKEFVPLILLGRLTSGAPLPVRVDPADPQNVVVDWQNAGFAAGTSPFAASGGMAGPMAGPPGAPMAGGQMSGGGAGSTIDESLSEVQAALGQSAGQVASPFAAPANGNYTIEQLRAHLRATGLEGSARIDQLTDTGQIVGDERLYTMQVTLELPGQAPQKLAPSAAMVPLTAMHKVRVGWRVPVRVAADNHQLLMFEWDRA